MTNWLRHLPKGASAAVLAVALWAAPQSAGAQYFGYDPYYGGYGTGYGYGATTPLYGYGYGGGREGYYDRMESLTDELDDESIFVTEAMEDYYNRLENRADYMGYGGYGGYGGLYRDYTGYYDWGF